MRAKIWLGLAGLVLALCAGCGDSPDSLMQDKLSILKDLTAILSSVKDEATATAAAPKIKALGARIQNLEKRRAALNFSQEQQAALDQKFTPPITAAAQGMAPEMQRVLLLGIKDKDFNDALKAGERPPE